MIIFLDLDGTLTDASDRMYRLFSDLSPEFRYSKEDYWKQKRNGINHKMMYDRAGRGSEFDNFCALWKMNIESKEYLQYDTLYPDVKECLANLCDNNKVYLLTARHNRENLLWELDRLEVLTLFSDVLCTEKYERKIDVLRNYCDNKSMNRSVLFVSDMGQEIELANSYGLSTVASTYGFMSKERLLRYKPLYSIDRFGELLGLMRNVWEENR